MNQTICSSDPTSGSSCNCNLVGAGRMKRQQLKEGEILATKGLNTAKIISLQGDRMVIEVNFERPEPVFHKNDIVEFKQRKFKAIGFDGNRITLELVKRVLRQRL